ncbi:endonuclease Q family protein [Candidatus Nitronereus thalassa]|uniref:Endonuclease Q family protein n=1 Tax=Candidatus Nitronereus thalassa TaxID=3020898 RepID=A0ABU3KBK8_9BACT|nr:endonuclease Q family protein [Candidatus Nitronereus thalassa]MDT7043895.1 endonuclease Q family protein [Candidatus Nitronereus thalassa]
MKPFIADLHIHSRFSRAVSKDMVPENLYRWAQLKGISVLGTGDFTHPGWCLELQEKIEPAEPGLYRLKPELAKKVDAEIPESCRGEVRFLLTSEISSIYKRYGRTRKVHNMIYASSFTEVSNLNDKLAQIGNIRSDGRPILGLDSEELLRIMLELSPQSLFVPAHAWTPHFSVFGANSGFDSLEECFGELTPHIKVIETGLSSDPPMNWRLSQLEGITLISNSDAHSPSKLGRECNVLNCDLSFEGIKQAFTNGFSPQFLGTIEFFPAEGKYYYDGHRNCQIRLTPEETRAHQGMCPECGKMVTVGVLHRTEALSDQPIGYRPEKGLPYWSLVPLVELLAEVRGAGVNTKGVQEAYHHMLARLGPELFILREIPLADIEENGGRLLALSVQLLREGHARIDPGYDGEFGRVRMLSPEDRD